MKTNYLLTFLTILCTGALLIAQPGSSNSLGAVIEDGDDFFERGRQYMVDGKIVIKNFSRSQIHLQVFDPEKNELIQDKKLKLDRHYYNFLTLSEGPIITFFYYPSYGAYVDKNDEPKKAVFKLDFDVNKGEFINEHSEPFYLGYEHVVKASFREDFEGTYGYPQFQTERSPSRNKTLLTYSPNMAEKRGEKPEIELGVIVLNNQNDMDWNHIYTLPFDYQHCKILDWVVDDNGIVYTYFAAKSQDAKKRQTSFDGIFIMKLDPEEEKPEFSSVSFPYSSFGNQITLVTDDEGFNYVGTLCYNGNNPELVIFDLEAGEELEAIASISLVDKLKEYAEDESDEDLLYGEVNTGDLYYNSLSLDNIQKIDSTGYIASFRDTKIIYGDVRRDDRRTVTLMKLDAAFNTDWIRKVPINTASAYYSLNKTLISVTDNSVDVSTFIHRENFENNEASKVAWINKVKPKKDHPLLFVNYSFDLKNGNLKSDVLIDMEELNPSDEYLPNVWKYFRMDDDSWLTIIQTEDGFRSLRF